MAARALWCGTLFVVSAGFAPGSVAADSNGTLTLAESFTILKERFLVEEVDRDVWEIRSRVPEEDGFRVIVIRDQQIYVDGELVNVVELQDRIGDADAEPVATLAYVGHHLLALDPLPGRSDDEREPQRHRVVFAIFGLVALAAGGLLLFLVNRWRRRQAPG